MYANYRLWPTLQSENRHIVCLLQLRIHVRSAEFLQRAAKLALQAAVYATVYPSVCPSVRHTPILCQNEVTQRVAVVTIG